MFMLSDSGDPVSAANGAAPLSGSRPPGAVAKEIEDTAKKYILYKLLHNDFSTPEHFPALFERFGIGFSDGRFAVAVIRFDDFREFEPDRRAHRISIFKFAMVNIALELLGRDFACEALENGPDHVTVILNGPSFGESRMLLLRAKLTETLAQIEELFRFSASAGIGTVAASASAIRTSYSNALTASEYRMFFGPRSVVAYDDIEDRELARIAFPYEEEQALLTGIRQNQPEHAAAGLDAFFEAVRAGSAQEVRLFLAQLGGSLSRLSHSSPQAEAFAEFDLRAFHRDLQGLDTLEQKKRLFADLLVDQLAAREQIDQRKKEAQMKAAKAFIAQNYGNSDLTVDIVAEHVQFSPSYLRKLFRDVCRCSPTDYIFHYRLEAAKRLLRETEYTAKDIAEKVGYLNTKYFYSIFKKSVGMTTFEYREKFRNASPNPQTGPRNDTNGVL